MRVGCADLPTPETPEQASMRFVRWTGKKQTQDLHNLQNEQKSNVQFTYFSFVYRYIYYLLLVPF